MLEARRRYDPEFRVGAVRIVRETGKTVTEVARDLDVHPATLRNWVNQDRVARGEKVDPARVDQAYVARLEREIAELRMERDVLKRRRIWWAGTSRRRRSTRSGAGT
jgi:transposase